MNCRICDATCEKSEPQFAGLCRACGQKRETYAAAALRAAFPPLILDGCDGSVGSEAQMTRAVRAIFCIAEKMVALDRKGSL